jgi:hypothetical protein
MRQVLETLHSKPAILYSLIGFNKTELCSWIRHEPQADSVQNQLASCWQKLGDLSPCNTGGCKSPALRGITFLARQCVKLTKYLAHSG